ncbi:MAG: hypothetical protein Q7S68_04075 [Deltaproteobacteria bacterium]|nr:hypothetical protein [Deltaproteobacteria bacterium]
MEIILYIFYIMNTRKIATNLPSKLLEEAVHWTGLNQTQTLIEGLQELISRKKREALLGLKGKIKIKVDTNKTRQRHKT